MTYDELLLDRYKGRGVIVDSNLLLLLIVGSYDINLIRKSNINKLSQYSELDYQLLGRLISIFPVVVVTPHILTEVSNLANDLPEQTRMAIFETFPAWLETLKEKCIAGLKVVSQAEFRFLGVTDTALATLSEKYLILTSDARFIAKLNDSGKEGLNFNHLRVIE